MKPFKKQIKPNQTKNNVNEKNSAQSIGSFFKAVPKSFVVEENVSASKPDNDHKKFYVDILKEKLRRKIYFINFIYVRHALSTSYFYFV